MKSLAHWLNRLRAGARILICLGVSIAVLIVALCCGLQILTGILLAWDVFCASLIVMSWVTIIGVPSDEVYRQAQRQDESRSIIFILIPAAVCVSIVGILIVLKPSDQTLISREVHRAISLLGVALSWILLHTIFTLRYAHLYYTDPNAGPNEQVGGLEFPNETKPDYLDFAYFSFVVGMTFQVSDVQVTARAVRKVVLMHGIISFVFNTIVVALTISILPNFVR